MYRTNKSAWSLGYPLKLDGVGPAKTQCPPSCLNKPDGMAVPGEIIAGSSIQRLVQPGLRRSLAKVKFGAVAFASRFGSPVAWHFRHGAPSLVNNCRAMLRSWSVSGSSFWGIYGWACEDIASKNRTNFLISPSEKWKVGIRIFKYCLTPFRSVSE